MATRLSSLWCGANSTASHVEPSSHSPSLSSTHRPKCLAVGLCGQAPCRSRPAIHGPANRWRPRRLAPVTVTWPGQRRSVGAIAFPAIPGEESAFRQHRVHGRGRMSLAEDEAVAVRPIWPGADRPAAPSIQDGQDVGHRKTRSDVRGPRAMDHAQRLQPNRSGKIACLAWIGRRLIGHGCKTDGVLSVLRCQATVFSRPVANSVRGFQPVTPCKREISASSASPGRADRALRRCPRAARDQSDRESARRCPSRDEPLRCLN